MEVDSSQEDTGLPGIGVFGTGPGTDIAVGHLRRAGFRIEAVWGKTSQEASGCANRLNVPFATANADDVLLKKDVDLILVLSPPSLHAQITVKALGIGKHVVVEAPAGINQNETLRKVKAALYYPSLISSVGYGLRFLPAFVRLKKVLRDEKYVGSGGLNLVDVRIETPDLISEMEAYSWACDDKMGGGVLNQCGSHVIDILQYLGFRASRVHGTVKTLKKETEKIRGIRQIQADDFANFQMEGCIEQGVDDDLAGREVFVTVSITSGNHSTARTPLKKEEFSQRMTFYGSDGHRLIIEGDSLLHEHAGVTTELISPFRKNEVPECELVKSTSTDNGRNSYRRIPAVHERGLAYFARHLADKMRKRADASKSGQDEPDVDGDRDIAADFNDALFVHAVLESVRWSSKNKAWCKVTMAQW